MVEWITTANGIITLITGLVGLIGTGIGAYFAVKNWITVLKTKNSNEIWAMIMEIADTAMTEAEHTDLKAGDKKEFAISLIAESCKAAGLEIDPFLTQLNTYIDSTIKFYNKMKKN